MPGLPPFQGGFAGVFSYELGHAWERLPRVAIDDSGYPALAVGCYDWVISWDHHANRAWIIAHGFPETTLVDRKKLAQNRIAEDSRPFAGFEIYFRSADRVEEQGKPARADSYEQLSREEYLTAVQRVIDYIRAGDIFQANLTQRLPHHWKVPAWNCIAV